MNYTLRNGRWHNSASPATPTPCASCNYPGAALRPHRTTGAPVCSVCDPSGFPVVPEELADAAFNAREQLPPHVVPTSIEGWVRRLAPYLARTRTAHPVTHASPTAGLISVVLAAELSDVCSPELVMRAAHLAGFPVLQTSSCTHVGMSAEPALYLPNTVRVEVGPAPAGWVRGAA